MFITKEDLKKSNPSKKEIKAFDRLFPNGLKLETKEDLSKALRKGFGRWLYLIKPSFKHLKTISGALDLRSCNLRGVNLTFSDLVNTDFSNADLRESDLRGACLRGSTLYGANLHGADLRNADLRKAYYQPVDLQGAFILNVYQIVKH